MRKIVCTIRKDGTATYEVVNGCGDDCVELTREFEQRLGTQVGTRELKPEYTEEVTEEERVRETGS